MQKFVQSFLKFRRQTTHHVVHMTFQVQYYLFFAKIFLGKFFIYYIFAKNDSPKETVLISSFFAYRNTLTKWTEIRWGVETRRENDVTRARDHRLTPLSSEWTRAHRDVIFK
jgi:hypothetical protein